MVIFDLVVERRDAHAHREVHAGRFDLILGLVDEHQLRDRFVGRSHSYANSDALADPDEDTDTDADTNPHAHSDTDLDVDLLTVGEACAFVRCALGVVQAAGER
jgi:hypothetical protein